MLFVGVDLGTSAVKLLLMDENGKIKNIVSKEYPLYFPHPGWSEQKPEDWFAQSMEGLKELLEGFDKDQVKGISFGGQPGNSVERRTYCKTDRLPESGDWKREAFRVYSKYCICRIYSTEDSLDEGK